MPTTKISIEVDGGFWLGVGAIVGVTLMASLWLVSRTDFVTRFRRHLRRWAPIYLVLGPPAVTYIIVCGFCSLVYASQIMDRARFAAMPRQEIIKSSSFLGFYAIEWACSVAGMFGFAWLVRWLRLPVFWYGVIAAAMSLTAVYRTARCESGPDGIGFYRSGPEFLLYPVPVDALPVISGLAIFLAACSRYSCSPAEQGNAADSR